jgi:hypothetical protein
MPIAWLKANTLQTDLLVRHPPVAGRHEAPFHGGLPEQISMGSGALKPDVATFLSERVNQKPVRFDVAVTAARKVAAQRVILVGRRQFITGNQQIEDGLELFQSLTALASPFDIPLELGCSAEGPHKPRSA